MGFAAISILSWDKDMVCQFQGVTGGKTDSQVGTTGIAGGLPSPRRALLLAPLKGYLRLGLNPVLVPVSSYYVLP